MKTSMHTIGEYIANKYRHRANMVGVRAVAQQLRKQGFSLDMALLILLGTRERGAALRGLPAPGSLVPWNGTDSIEAAIQRQHIRQMEAMQNVGLNAGWNANHFGNHGWLFGIRAAGL